MGNLVDLDGDDANFDYKRLHRQPENHALLKPPFNAFCVIAFLAFAATVYANKSGLTGNQQTMLNLSTKAA